jgi:Spy/CpxP family protein refolding chaperone
MKHRYHWKEIEMKKNGFLIIAACFITGLVVTSASAQMGGGKGRSMGMCGGGHAMHIFSKLGLDDNQSKEVKAIAFKMQKDMVRKQADAKIARIELREILGNDQVDVKVAETKVKQIASLKAEAAMIRIQGIEDIKAKLTPEQKKKLSEMLQMKRMWHTKRMMQRGMEHVKDMKDCPMMKSKMDTAPDSGTATAKPVKNKAPKAFPPAQ